MNIPVKRIVVLGLLLLFTGLLSYLGFTFYKLKQSQVYFDNLEEAFDNPDHVEVLILRNQELTSLPDNIQEFKKLRTLNIANNKLGKLPESIGNLSQLE